MRVLEQWLQGHWMSQVRSVLREDQSLEKLLVINIRAKHSCPLLSQATAVHLEESQTPGACFCCWWWCFISNIRKQSIQHQTLTYPPYGSTHLVILRYLLQAFFSFFSKDVLHLMRVLCLKGIRSLSSWISYFSDWCTFLHFYHIDYF